MIFNKWQRSVKFIFSHGDHMVYIIKRHMGTLKKLDPMARPTIHTMAQNLNGLKTPTTAHNNQTDPPKPGCIFFSFFSFSFIA